VVGLGTGSTASLFLAHLAERIQRKGLEIRGVPTSEATARLAESLRIPLVELAPSSAPDLVVDGADEADRQGRLIKGGGGALVREKMVAEAGRGMAVMVHWAKVCPELGAFPLPVAVLPFAWRMIAAAVSSMGAAVRLRSDRDGGPRLSDDGLMILDCAFGRIPEPEALEEEIERIPGVVACGLFTGLATRLLVGGPDGDVEEFPVPADAD
jgi:ribose 5-phosphate isomerase A